MKNIATRLVRTAILLASTLGLVAAPTVALADEVFDAAGANPNRDTFSQLPFEHVDPMTGNLLLTWTDLVLPGNGGFDLRIQRTYNSKIYRTFGNTATNTLEEDTWAGVGWSLHLGRLGVSGANPGPVEMSDGRRHALYPVSGMTGPEWISKEFWRYNSNTNVLKLPNGVVYTFAKLVTLPSGQQYRYVTSIADPYGNLVTVSYMTAAGAPPDGIQSINQDLGTQSRVIQFEYGSTYRNLSRMTYLGRAWTYTPAATNSAGFHLLASVTPPVSADWVYTYHNGAAPKYELASVRTPQGGLVSFTYKTVNFRIGNNFLLPSRVVSQRTASGRDVPGGTWSYLFGSDAPGAGDQTEITSPCGKLLYSFYGVGTTAGGRPAWEVGLLKSKTTKTASGTTLQTEQYTWRPPVFADRISDQDEGYGGPGGAFSSETYVPLLAERTITRHGRTYLTTNTYNASSTPSHPYNDYGRPQQVDEVGERTRRTNYTYTYAFTPYIADRILQEVLTEGSESFANSYTYVQATGFKSSETLRGIVTAFTPDGRGNVQQRTPAAGGPTSYTYSWGVLEDTHTPLFSIDRTINTDGTVQSETRRGFTTGFQYDALSRLTRIVPDTTVSPVSNPTDIGYHVDSSTGLYTHTRTTRGNWFLQTNIDGFGRPSSTADSVGVQGDMTFDACGRQTYASYPYDSVVGNHGVSSTYDALGRILSQESFNGTASGDDVTYGYGTGSVTITNERGVDTLQEWQAYGDPDAGVLTAVTEPGANAGRWVYQYNALGSLRIVTPPSGTARHWTYYANEAGGRPGLLRTEVSPEGGTTSYTYYADGKVATRTDANGAQTTYQYDANRRLTTLDRAGATFDVTMGYDASDNRTSLTTSTVASTFVYDGVNRLRSRTDVVGGHSYATTYLPDGNDNVDELTYPSLLKVKYGYDNGNRVNSVTRMPASPLASNVLYHPSGQVGAYTAGNGLAHTFQYDARYRMTRLQAGTLLDMTYGSYDGRGNPHTIDDARSGMDQSYDYDETDRLTIANGPWGNGNFVYSKVGDRTSKTVGGSTSYVYSGSTGRLMSATGVGAATFGYDNNGNTTSTNADTFGYTPDNLMSTATVGGVATSYFYDGDNLRKRRTGAGTTPRVYIHGLGERLLAEYDEPCAGQRQVTREYVYLGQRLLASVVPSSGVTTIGWTAASSTTPESGSVTVTARLNAGNGVSTACPVSATYGTMAGSAAAGQDFTSVSGPINFSSGSPHGASQNVPVAILTDTRDEHDETFTVRLAGIMGAAPATVDHVVTITDDDAPPTMSIGDVTVTEGDSGSQVASFTVSLSAQSGKNITASYAATPGTASTPADFTVTPDTLTFAPDEVSKPVSATIAGDLTDETDETFSAVLSNVVNATLVDGTGVGTILDNDAPPDLSLLVPDPRVLEPSTGTRDAVFRLGLSRASGKTVTVGYATAGGTATSPLDFAATSGTATLQPGETRIAVPVPVSADTQAESDEAFTLGLSKASNATLVRSQGTATITESAAAARGDLDADLRSDLIWRNHNDGDNAAWFMAPDGFTVADTDYLFNVSLPWTVAGVGDLDADGRADIFWRNPQTGDNAVWLMDGATILQSAYLNNLPGPWVVAGMGDLDADGRADVVWRDASTGDNAAWLMNGNAVASTAYLFNVPAPWEVGGVADVDANGKADLVWRQPVTGDNALWLMNGTAIASTHTLAPLTPGWRIESVTDLDVDRKSDILWRHPASGSFAVWLLNGPTVTASSNASVDPSWLLAGVGDLDGDGKGDVVWRNPVNGEHAVWLMDATFIGTSSLVPNGNLPGAEWQLESPR